MWRKVKVSITLPSSFLLTKQRCSRVCRLAVGAFNTPLPPAITKINHLSSYTGKKQVSMLLHCVLHYYSCYDPFSCQQDAHSTTVLWPLVDDAEPETSSKGVYSLLAARKHWHKKTGREKPSLGLLNSLLFPCLFSPRIKLPLVSFGVICRNYSSHGRVRSWVLFRWRNSATNRSSLYHLVEVGTSY